MEETLINRVANSGIITINLEEYYPTAEIKELDIKQFLYLELLLKEKEFRAALKEYDWSQYSNSVVLCYCSTDAIVPVWAYMLISAYLKDIASDVYLGNSSEYLNYHYKNLIDTLDITPYQDERVVIKGCSKRPVPAAAYAYLTYRLKDHVQSLMYGEPCSTVPIAKRPRKLT